ncbi:MAG: VOC family protein [Planctomycetaceae bacterium]|nr:VOC family protein [Planctomycetaceae bacterium]
MELSVDSIRIFVADLERAIPFYAETLGLPLLDSDIETGYAVLDAGGITIILELDDEEESDDAETMVGVFTGVSFAVNDIYGAHKEMVEKGVHFDEPPASQPWGGVLGHFSDPDRNVLTLVQYPENE